MRTDIFNSLKFASVPFIGIGNAKRTSLFSHPYLSFVKAAVYSGKTPWNNNKSTIVGLSHNNNVFACLAVDGESDTKQKQISSMFNVTTHKLSNTEYDINIEVTSATPREVSIEATPQIFSAMPLDITYSIELDKLITKVPKNPEGRLMMQSPRTRLMNGQIFVPAGEIVDLGPILKVIRRKKSSKFSEDSHLITRRVHLSIRKRLYEE